MSYAKWTPQILDLSRAYIQESNRPSISGLSRMLGVSRQCMYDWALVHKDFFMVLNELRASSISALGDFESYNHRGSLVRAKRLESEATNRAERSAQAKIRRAENKEARAKARLIQKEANRIEKERLKAKRIRDKAYREKMKAIRDKEKAEAERIRIASIPKGEFEDELGSDDEWDLDI